VPSDAACRKPAALVFPASCSHTASTRSGISSKPRDQARRVPAHHERCRSVACSMLGDRAEQAKPGNGRPPRFPGRM